jgi:HlyD family secretion protein
MRQHAPLVYFNPKPPDHESYSSIAPKLVSLCCGCVVACLTVMCAAAAVAQMPPARVVVAPVQQRELATGQTFVGTVEASRISTVGSTVEGRVVEFLVNEGDAVSKDDVLARLRTRQLEIKLAVAQAELELRRHELAELEKSLPLQIEQAHARMLAAKALMDYTQARKKRNEALFSRKVTSETDMQEIISLAEGAQQKYRENQSAWKMATATRTEKIEQSRSQVLSADEETNRLKDEIEEHTIRAPFNGYVTAEHTEVGQWIAKGNSVVEIVEIDSVEVEVPVPESYISQLRLGMTARVTMGALPGRSWLAPMVAIVPRADVRSRSFPVKVRLKNEEGANGPLFRPGMFARVTLAAGKKGNVLVVPKDAVVFGGEVPTVYAVAPMPPAAKPPAAKPGPAPPSGVPQGPAPDAIARRVAVEIGASVEDLIEIRGQIKAGERVVVEGNERLFPGQPLIIVNKDESKPTTAGQ